MRVLIVCGADFRGPGEKQALGAAEGIVAAGHEVLLAVHGDPDPAPAIGRPPRDGVGIVLARPDRALARATSRFVPDVVHVWSPRARTLAAAGVAHRAHPGARLHVHLEDDEWGLAERRARHAARPARLADALAQADGIDALTPALAAEARRRTGRDDVRVVLPVLPDLPHAPGNFGLRGGEVVLHTGGLFRVHVRDFLILARAVALMRAEGRDTRLVHVGPRSRRVRPRSLLRAAGLDRSGATFTPAVPLAAVPALLREADVLVQPGAPDDFNRLRLPSKLQAYLASGRPVVTFAAGAGELLADGTEALLTHTGEPVELAQRLTEVLSDAALARRLGEGGRAAAARLFDPERNTAELLAGYEL